MILKKLARFFISLVFPITCFGCGLNGCYLCEKCFRKLRFLENKNISTDFLDSNLDGLYFAGDYKNKLLASLIRAFKYEKIPKLGGVLSRFLNLFWQGKLSQIKLQDREKEKDLASALVCPVPLSSKRKRFRGFNQAEILASLFCLEFSQEIFLHLKRRNRKKNQAELKREDRIKNVSLVFYCPKKYANIIKNKTFILIDDVATTGATINEVARVLKSLGATRVYALLVAKA